MRFLELMRVVGGGGVMVEEVRAGGGGDVEVLGVCEDSRKVRAGDVFVTRQGTKKDGVEFVAEAIARGAVGVVMRESPGIAIPGLSRVGFARVGNVNVALALLAHAVAGRPTEGMKMIGVTGTKGKTTVAYLMRSVLRAAGCVVGMVGTVEIDDGKEVAPAEMTTPGVVELVALFSRMKKNGVTHCVMEVSSHALDQDRVAGIDFDVAMFTNLTGDHLDYHGTMEAYGAAKKRLFSGLEEDATAVVNVDDAWGEKMAEGCKAKILRYGIDRICDWRATIWSMSVKGTSVEIDGPAGEQVKLYSPLVGKHNVYNTLCCLSAARGLGIEMKYVVDGLDEMEGVPGRLQRVLPAPVPFEVFVDYAHTHDALENVLRTLHNTSLGHGRIICVFGCGGDRDRTKRPKMARIAEELADIVIVTSDNPRTEDPERIIEEVCSGFSNAWRDSKNIFVEPDRRAAIRLAMLLGDDDDAVLIAGKGHEKYQIVGTTKTHFDDVEEAAAAMFGWDREANQKAMFAAGMKYVRSKRDIAKDTQRAADDKAH